MSDFIIACPSSVCASLWFNNVSERYGTCMAITQPLLCHRNFLEPLRLDVCAALSTRRFFLLTLGSLYVVGDISLASLLFGAPRSVPSFCCCGYSELIYKERSPCGRLLTLVFHIPSENLCITKDVFASVRSTNTTGNCQKMSLRIPRQMCS